MLSSAGRQGDSSAVRLKAASATSSGSAHRRKSPESAGWEPRAVHAVSEFVVALYLRAALAR